MALSRQHTFFESGTTSDTMAQLNEEVLLTLQIEHRYAIENLPDILSVPGIDAAFVGPEDLAASLGRPGQTSHPDVEKAVRYVVEVCDSKGIIPGIHTGSVEKAKYWIDQGMRMVGFGTDIKIILNASRSSIRELRSLV